MKPRDVSSIAFVEDSISSSSSFLLQGALHLAEQGFTVCVISTKQVQSLPPPVHGVVMPGADVFSLIRFLYLPRWQDLLQHLYSIHLHAHIPSVIILESAQDYFLPKQDENFEESETAKVDLKHASLIFASLIDAVAVCGRMLKTKTHVLVSIKQSAIPEASLNIILNTFFNDCRWYVQTEPANDESSVYTIVLKSLDRKCELRFSQEKGLALILKEIINFTC